MSLRYSDLFVLALFGLLIISSVTCGQRDEYQTDGDSKLISLKELSKWSIFIYSFF